LTTAAGATRSGESPRFEYEAQTGQGESIRGTLEAESAAAANGQLEKLGLRVLAVNPAAATGRLRQAAIGPDDFLLFNQQLAHMTAAGLPIEAGLRLIAADLSSGRLAKASREVAEDLERGMPLHDAFARHGGRFPPLYARLVEAGARANNLPAMLLNFGRHVDLKLRLRRSLWRTLSYPVAVVLALCGVMLFVSLTVLPQMAEIYRDFKTTLPTLTEWLLLLGPLIPYVIGALGVIVAAIGLTALVMQLLGKGGTVTDEFVLRVPLVGAVVRRSMLARWCDAVRIGVEAGLDLPRALSLAGESVGSPRLRDESGALAETLSRGASPLSFSGKLLPAAVPAAIEYGGKAGDLPATLATMARMYEQQADQQMRTLPAILTPVLLVTIGGFVFLTVLALFLPLMRIMHSVSGGEF
jgi:type II secretory pathway component PulF